jgi:hypothetical protein
VPLRCPTISWTGRSTAARYNPIRSMICASAANIPRSRYQAPVAATQKAPVRNEASSIWGNRTQSTGLKRILNQSFGAKTPFSNTYPTGTCIQLLLPMIQNAETMVPNATIAVENR